MGPHNRFSQRSKRQPPPQSAQKFDFPLEPSFRHNSSQQTDGKMANLVTPAIVGASVVALCIVIALFEKCFPRSILIRFMDKRLWGLPYVFLVLAIVASVLSSAKESDSSASEYETLSYSSGVVFVILAIFALYRWDKSKPVEPGAGRYWLTGNLPNFA